MSQVKGIHHFSLLADAVVIDKVKRFYVDILGLVEGFRPDFGIAGHWLYAGDDPILHLIALDGIADADVSNGCFDHIALRCDELEAMKEKLNTHGVEFGELESEEVNQTQLFITDPAGIKVELNFINR